MMKLKTGDLLQSLPIATVKTNAVLDGPPSVEGLVVPNLGVNRRHTAPAYGTSAVDVNLARYCPPLVLQRLILKRKPSSYLSALELQHFRNYGILPRELEVTGRTCGEEHCMAALSKPSETG